MKISYDCIMLNNSSCLLSKLLRLRFPIGLAGLVGSDTMIRSSTLPPFRTIIDGGVVQWQYLKWTAFYIVFVYLLLLWFGMVTQSLNDIATQPFTYFLSPFLSTGSGPLVLGPWQKIASHVDPLTQSWFVLHSVPKSQGIRHCPHCPAFPMASGGFHCPFHMHFRNLFWQSPSLRHHLCPPWKFQET